MAPQSSLEPRKGTGGLSVDKPPPSSPNYITGRLIRLIIIIIPALAIHACALCLCTQRCSWLPWPFQCDRLAALAGLSPVSTSVPAASSSTTNAVSIDRTSFSLNGDNVSYRIRVDHHTRDILLDHYGGPITEDPIRAEVGPINGWVNTIGRVRREFPDLGRGDFRSPAVQIHQSDGSPVSDFRYQSHHILQGKPALKGLPSTFGQDTDVRTLIFHLYDNYSSVAADLTYSIFPKYDAIARSVRITNQGEGNITVTKLSSMSVDLTSEQLDMLELRGDWAREGMRVQRPVGYGTQGFGSQVGYSSHLHNPFFALIDPRTSESQGEAWGFSLIYTGSFSVEVEKSSQDLTRAQLGLNPSQLSYPLGPGETLQSPEAVTVYSDQGVGGMSRKFHKLYQNHLIKSKYATETRPVLLNSWEGLGFNYNQSTIYKLAQETAELGASMFVLDDGWFGNKYPRISDNAGLGDWTPNPKRFPGGLTPLVEDITALKVHGSRPKKKLRFGLWFEPEMVNPRSSLYHEHPEWVLHAGNYPRSLTRNQLVLDVGLPEVQDFIVDSVSNILINSNISYVKWDNNRGIHETAEPYADYKYMLGLYSVFERLTSMFPDVLWEGCASGGGRFDPGILQYFPQIWTSDDTDAVERLHIQFGTSLAYPPAAMGAHISAIPNGVTGRNTSITFRAHVAMMGGSFGLELNPSELTDSERDLVPGLIATAEKIGPIIITGDLYRLQLPSESNFPAAMFVSEDGNKAIVFYFQLLARFNDRWPVLRLQGLDPKARYSVDGKRTYSGATLMNGGLSYSFQGDYDSRILILEKH